MNIFIYVRERIPYALDEIEDALGASLEGIGDVTGSGTGVAGSNFDIEIEDESVDPATAIARIREGLRPFDLPPSSVAVVNGTEFRLVSPD
ncbi:MAG TPA: hypothetical protein VK797_08645 [Tepidisphaeraceae bacterium]|nr:hypothetical protein [Tepidisphaeraceae bacterium]